MAEIVEGMPGRNHCKEYPWDEWLDGQTRRLKKGEDFTCPVVNMRSQVYVAAKRLGKKVRISLTSDDSLYIKATEKQ